MSLVICHVLAALRIPALLRPSLDACGSRGPSPPSTVDSPCRLDGERPRAPFWLLFPVLLLVTGCASLPPVELPAAGKVPRAFAVRLAERFQLTNSVVFRFRGREMAGIGLVNVDRADESFALVCLTPLGVKLFELQGRGEKVEAASALEAFAQKGDVAGAVAGDVRRAYFDVVPPPDSAVRGKRATLTFRGASPRGHAEYVFDAAGVLIEKRLYAGRSPVWRVRYGYREEAGRLIPSDIVIDNLEYGYRLTVRAL